MDKVLADHLLYDYIMGLKGWKDKNSDTSNIYLLKVLNNDKRLGYAMYAVGVNYYEMAIRTGSNDFSKAIEYYLDSLKILPDHFEGYFALGHCYKKADMKLEALRAFRKVVELVPYEDHRVDPYGIVVHSLSQITTLVAELGKEAN
jgi:tetratricopeptide (TPR) repeat protein